MKFQIKVETDAEHGYRAVCPGLPGCCIYASSREAAVMIIQQAVQGYLASLDASVPAGVEPVLVNDWATCR